LPSGFDPTGGIRFSEKLMLKQKARAGCRSNHNSSRSSGMARAWRATAEAFQNYI
jgi:hypothetical protein